MNKLKFLGVAAIFLAVISSFRLLTPKEVVTTPIRKSFTVNVTDPPCIQVYSCIEFYADSFNIPRQYAYGIASLETGYKGPFHWKYKNTQISPTGALGPMQVLKSTARWVNKDQVSKEILLNDVKYNIMTSMKYLRMLHNQYKNWKIVFGYYNTGYPRVNGYAERVYNHKIDWR
jgi:soluble lytic murein transglycosylase-like protein